MTLCSSGLISIPVWCDLEFESNDLTDWKIKISIPVWCDLETLPAAIHYLRACISIPVWCDLESLASYRLRFRL